MFTIHEDEVPEARSQGEVNIHLGYIRRDIKNLQQETQNALKSIADQIGALDDHYISEAEFRPVADTVKEHDLALKSMAEWRDTLNGKLAGFGIAIGVGSTILSFALNYFL